MSFRVRKMKAGIFVANPLAYSHLRLSCVVVDSEEGILQATIPSNSFGIRVVHLHDRANKREESREET